MELGTPGGKYGRRLMLLGCGELGREVAIAAQRLGIEVIAVDRYAGAPAMAVAHRSHVIDMLDGQALEELVDQERPTLIVPEIEAIDTARLQSLETKGWSIVPNALATRLTMDREGIRQLAAQTLRLPTSPFQFVDSQGECLEAARRIGWPVIIKPVMSSSGKGQSLVADESGLKAAWRYAQTGGRAGGGRCIVEGVVEFDFEITLLTVRHRGGTHFCDAIGHRQEDGDYRESWQPQPMSSLAWERATEIARSITEGLGGFGVFGVELFVKGDEVFFSEVSPRPHDTGLVTMATQNLSQFELHVRAILGLPIPAVNTVRPGASAVILGEASGRFPIFAGVDQALETPEVTVHLFGKPQLQGRRRLGVVTASADDVDQARKLAREAAAAITVSVEATASE